MREELRKLLDESCDLFDTIDEKIHIMEKAKAEGKLSNVLKYELVAFLMCISAVDGRISRVEAKLIRDYFGIEVYPIHIKEIIHQNGIGEDVYFQKVPECIKIAVDFDNTIHELGVDIQMGVSVSILELFKAFGKEMVVADEKVKFEERWAWETYISLISQFIVDNCKNDFAYKGKVYRPGEPINVDYEMSLGKVGRAYELFIEWNNNN